MPDLMENVAANLQQRIGQLVSQYETDVAILKSQFSQQIQEKEAELQSVKEQLEAATQSLTELKGTDVSEEAPTASTDAPPKD